jgi:hypothetical protein
MVSPRQDINFEKGKRQDSGLNRVVEYGMVALGASLITNHKGGALEKLSKLTPMPSF